MVQYSRPMILAEHRNAANRERHQVGRVDRTVAA
jgi:hypothetical protein